ncbi:MAG: aldo/keto reductase [Acidobacteriota bacterium]|nr:aldo/keto reductase [Acidobacteriota bacterium]
MKDKLTRREFLEQTTLTVSATACLASTDAETFAASKNTIPRRKLGRTGVEVPALAFGGGSRFLMYKDEEEALRVLNQVIEMGVTYIDTAAGYGNGLSETRIGKVLKARRKEVFLATKIPERARTRDAALREFELSLKRLQTDRVDLLHIHSLTSEDDLAKIEAPDGAMKALYELREQKVARFIGMTSHTDGAVMKKAIEHNDLDCVQMALNPSRTNNFEKLALPAAKKKNLGVILMKATAQGKLVGSGAGVAEVESLLRYALSLPVSTMVVGMPQFAHIEQNVAAVKGFKPMTPAEMDTLAARVSPSSASLHEFFLHHQDSQLA